MFAFIPASDFVNPSTFEGAIFLGIAFALVAWVVGWLLRMAVQRMLAHDKHDHFDRMAIKFLAKLSRYAVYIFAFISYVHFVPGISGMGMVSLASVSVISVVLGLAAQNTLGNVIAGISLLLYRPFKLGDRLQVLAPTGLETGTVESLTLGYTLLRTDENRKIVVPNSLMASQTNINLSPNNSRILCTVPVCIGYESNIDQARAILIDLAGKHPKTLATTGCPITQLSGSGIVFSLELWCSDALTAITIRGDLLDQIVKRFSIEGIQFGFSQTRLLLRDDLSISRSTPIVSK